LLVESHKSRRAVTRLDDSLEPLKLQFGRAADCIVQCVPLERTTPARGVFGARSTSPDERRHESAKLHVDSVMRLLSHQPERLSLLIECWPSAQGREREVNWLCERPFRPKRFSSPRPIRPPLRESRSRATFQLVVSGCLRDPVMISLPCLTSRSLVIEHRSLAASCRYLLAPAGCRYPLSASRFPIALYAPSPRGCQVASPST